MGPTTSSLQKLFCSQATHITFICPMLFDSFPLDTQTCKFQVGHHHHWWSSSPLLSWLSSTSPWYISGWFLLVWHGPDGFWDRHSWIYSTKPVHSDGLWNRDKVILTKVRGAFSVLWIVTSSDNGTDQGIGDNHHDNVHISFDPFLYLWNIHYEITQDNNDNHNDHVQ